MNHPIRCGCGKFQAEVAHPERGTRAVCYCRDCQAFAHFLGPPPGMLDALGGTDIVAVRPRHLRFISGTEHLACMSLSPRGTLRWFTACCRTPIGNAPRDLKVSHLGLVHCALEAPGVDLTRSFGPVRMRVNRQGAHGPTPGNAPLTFAGAMLRYGAGLAWSRVSGGYERNPLFDASSGAPIVAPQVLSADARRRLAASF